MADLKRRRSADTSDTNHPKRIQHEECCQVQDDEADYIFTPSRQPTSIFSYKPLRSNEIRLIDFDASSAESVVVYATLNYKVPEYTALSYCWGSENCLHPFELNGQTLILTSSLLSLFQYLVNVANFRGKLWADAICINQNDNGEKAVQIPLMGRIYSGANQVYAWLDIEQYTYYEFPTDLLDLERSLKLLLDEGGPVGYEFGWVTEIHVTDRIWPLLIKIVRSSWFRLWIFPEFLLGSHVVFCIGSLRCSLERLENLAMALDLLRIQMTIPEFMDGYGSCLRRILGLCKLRRHYQRYQSLHSLLALQKAQILESTNDSDKVYALLNIAGIGERFPIDLSESTVAVYTRLSREIVMLQDWNLQLLALASCQSSLPGLPSWVPDLSTDHFLPTCLGAHKFTAGLRKMNPPLARAAGVRDSSIFTARGIVLSHVTSRILWRSYGLEADCSEQERAAWAKENYFFLMSCAALGQLTLDLPSEMAVRQVFRTLVVDRPSSAASFPTAVSDSRSERLSRERFQEKHVAVFVS